MGNWKEITNNIKMTNEEAIEVLEQGELNACNERERVALIMAINSLNKPQGMASSKLLANITITDEQVQEITQAVIDNFDLKKGVWVGIDQEPHEEWECDNCGNIINTYLQDELEEHKYCHKCGAKMSTPWAEMESEE